MFRLAMSATAEIGDQWGKFEYVPGGSISVHPGETKPTSASFTGLATPLVLSVAPACPGSDGVDVDLRADGREVAHFAVDPGAAATLPTTNPAATYKLTISKRANAWCDVVTLAPTQ
jgi:hypothetical protein